MKGSLSVDVLHICVCALEREGGREREGEREREREGGREGGREEGKDDGGEGEGEKDGRVFSAQRSSKLRQPNHPLHTYVLNE